MYIYSSILAKNSIRIGKIVLNNDAGPDAFERLKELKLLLLLHLLQVDRLDGTRGGLLGAFVAAQVARSFAHPAGGRTSKVRSGLRAASAGSLLFSL
jgi:hypothetical protein